MVQISEARKRANKKWNDANMRDRYDRIQIVVEKGQKDFIKGKADQVGEGLSEFIKVAIQQRIQRMNESSE